MEQCLWSNCNSGIYIDGNMGSRTHVRGHGERCARRQSGMDANKHDTKQVLYGLPITINKITDLSDLWDEAAKDGAIVRPSKDHPKQEVEALEDFEMMRSHKRQWPVFVKVWSGSHK